MNEVGIGRLRESANQLNYRTGVAFNAALPSLT